MIASLIETYKLNGVDPYAYLAATISTIVNGHPNARLDELLPWAYPAATALKRRGLKTALTMVGKSAAKHYGPAAECGRPSPRGELV